ncbi:MAG: FAD-binding oxidoreductase [Firmicutes bacterium]|nr:FAD-binding oxidoreductase [Bacillota bacterium]
MSELVIDLKDNQFQDYLRDESRSIGQAESISFPCSLEEVKEIVALTSQQQLPLTVQGARTGLAGGAVPYGGHVMNLSRLNRIKGLRHDPVNNTFFLIVEPGVLLTEIRQALQSLNFSTNTWTPASIAALDKLRQQGPYFFPPDPTETSASIGGMIACNASGALTYFYGPTRNYIEAIRVVLMNGHTLTLRRGQHRVEDGRFCVQTDEGETISGELPPLTMPEVKNASGYYLKQDMDLIDLFIGSEGTLGIIVEAELKLLPAPKALWGITAFMPTEEAALRLVRAVRGEEVDNLQAPRLPKPGAIEYFNCDALALLRQQREHNPAFGHLQELRPHYHTAIYLEWHGNSDEELYQVVLELGGLIEACGGNEEDTWVAATPNDLEQLKFFRHATPECVNMLIDQRRQIEPKITKLGTDMAVPDQELIRVVDLYNRDLAASGLESVMFGHIGNNHIHVNILPRNLEDYRKGRELYLKWAQAIVAMGGTVSAEHGIGKIKTAFLAEMYGADGIEKFRTVKRIFDPAQRLNPGNLFENGGGE